MIFGKASDHLANERTFLAWVRTALALIGLGFVLARMGLFLRQFAFVTQNLGAPAAVHSLHAGHEFIVSGVIFLVIGIGFCVWAGWEYRRNLRAIDTERFEPAKGAVLILTAVVVVGGLALVGLVLWRTLGGVT